MIQRPQIFVSSVTQELKSARELVANTLIFLGYEPIWHDIPVNQPEDLRGKLRRKLALCQGLIQIIGQHHGCGPTDPQTDPHAVSYTQFELLHTRTMGKPVWPILLSPDYPTDASNSESAAHKISQERYRQRMEKNGDYFLTASDADELEEMVLKLRKPLEQVRREWEKKWRKATRVRTCCLTGIAAVLTVGFIYWWFADRNVKTAAAKNQDTLMAKENDSGSANAFLQLANATAEIQQRNALMRTAYDKFPRVYQQTASAGHSDDIAGRLARAYRDLELAMNLPAGNLATDLPAYARQLLQRPETSTLDRACALFATGKFDQAETEYRILIPIQERVLGPEHPDTLSSKMGLASALDAQGKPSEAEHRQILHIQERVLGPEHSDTLSSRIGLAEALDNQGKHTEAEAEYRPVLEIQERVLGMEHPDTLRTLYHLADTLMTEGRKKEAQPLAKRAVDGARKILGAEHPATLSYVRFYDQLNKL